MSRYSVTYDTFENESRIVSTRSNTVIRSYFTHVSVEGDSFTSLALKYLQDEKQYWVLADYNPQIKFPDFITPGTVLRIPLR